MLYVKGQQHHACQPRVLSEEEEDSGVLFRIAEV